jgi:predicted phage-related endonuclease
MTAAQAAIHQEHEHGSEAWLSERRNYLGGSEVGAALGLVPDSDYFSKPIDVWLSKTGQERVTPINAGPTEAGKRLEPVIRDWYTELCGEDVRTHGTIRHPGHQWIGSTPDAIVVRNGRIVRNVQVKVVGYRAAFSWPGRNSIDEIDGSLIINDGDGVPDYYRVQVEWEMEVLSAYYGVSVDETHLAALVGGTDLRVFLIPRDPELWETLFESARKFWFEHVVADVPPHPDHSEAFTRYLARRYPKAEREELLPMSAEIEQLARRYLRARDIESRAKDSKDQAANELRGLIGTDVGYRQPGLKAAWRNTAKGRVLDVRETKS